MNRLLITLALLMFMGATCSGQRLFYSSKDIKKPYEGKPIKYVEPHWGFSSTINVRYADGQTQIVPVDSIWGYQTRNGRIFRYQDRTYYKLIDTTRRGFIRYEVLRPKFLQRYFSRDLDSPIRISEERAKEDTASTSN